MQHYHRRVGSNVASTPQRLGDSGESELQQRRPEHPLISATHCRGGNYTLLNTGFQNLASVDAVTAFSDVGQIPVSMATEFIGLQMSPDS